MRGNKKKKTNINTIYLHQTKRYATI